ncbi:MAG: YdcF family protein [Bacteroidota bacterium]|nr:YdcF family protein [Bacteroidota bacterium]MDP4255996.1 YdcF family protein [Bacteroidota bacterium]MDP4257473.1 YdcF family protein [Bacteroidota bacterium]
MTRVDPSALDDARILWDYHHMGHTPEKSDTILVLGSHDLRVAECGAGLWLQGLAPWLILSGGLGNVTRGIWAEPEADRFAAIAYKMGVPPDAILIENRSTNTGENILFTRRLLQERSMDPRSFLLVQKPYMERRSYATFKRQWPDKQLLVTSPRIPFEEYPTEEIPMARVIEIMVGDLQRIRYYPGKGFQIPQLIPDEVWNAYERLVAKGFSRHLANL